MPDPNPPAPGKTAPGKTAPGNPTPGTPAPSGSGKKAAPGGRGDEKVRRGKAGRKGEEPRKVPSALWVIGALTLLIAGLFFIERSAGTGGEVPYGRFLAEAKAGNVADATIEGEVVTGRWDRLPDRGAKDEPFAPTFRTVVPLSELERGEPSRTLLANDAVVSAERTTVDTTTYILIYAGMGVLMLFLFLFLLRRSSDPMGGGGMLGGFVKSGAKRFREDDKRTTFEDVAGMEQAKQDLMEVVEFLKNPERFARLGAEIPKGVLLMGSPGTGKTLLARATAGEANVPFFSINGSEFIQMFVGVGASRVRDLFKTAREASPCIIFVDEIDAVGRERGSGLGGGHDEREQTLNQILGEMDGFAPSEAVIVIAATNRPDVLDPALLRPGRFDRHVQVDKPTKKGRVGILKVHTKKVPLDDTVDLEDVAAGSIGFSGAELKNLVNEAALLATRAERTAVLPEDFEEARDKVLMGAAREETMNDHERRMTAYHEAGHALIAWVLPSLDPVHKVTIIPRGRALGVTQLLPDEEKYHVGERKLRDQLAMVMGGRSAEKLIFDEYSAGAEDDLNRATQLARRMVAHWGMSEALGPVAFRQGETHPFLGKEMQTGRNFSDETARIIDREIQATLSDAADRATDLLESRKSDLHRIAEMLLDRESVSRADMATLLGDREQDPAYAPIKPHTTNGRAVSKAAEDADAEAAPDPMEEVALEAGV